MEIVVKRFDTQPMRFLRQHILKSMANAVPVFRERERTRARARARIGVSQNLKSGYPENSS